MGEDVLIARTGLNEGFAPYRNVYINVAAGVCVCVYTTRPFCHSLVCIVCVLCCLQWCTPE